MYLSVSPIGTGGALKQALIHTASTTESFFDTNVTNFNFKKQVFMPTILNSALLVGTATANFSGIANVLSEFVANPAVAQGAILAANTDATAPSIYVWNKATAANNLFVSFYTEAGAGTIANRGLIDYNRAGNATRYNTTSDAALKLNIVDAPDAGDLIDAIDVREFDWIDGGHTDFGIVAQELVAVFPDAVSPGEGARPWMYDPSKLVPLLLKELQTLRARVAQLEIA